MGTVVVDPVGRLEGHLRISIEVDGGKVISAKSSGTSFRGIENILKGRDPRDAPQITQRICGVCPIPHAVASSIAFESAAGISVNAQARWIRNLAQAANFVESHLLHFYAFTLPDYVTGLPTTQGWKGASSTAWRQGPRLSKQPLAEHVVQSFQIRRLCHETITALAGKMPHPPGIIPGGVTGLVADSTLADLAEMAGKIAAFVDGAYADDIAALCEDFADYEDIGQSGAGYLSFGAFPSDNDSLLLPKGYLAPNAASAVAFDPLQISESTAHARFGLDNGGHPSQGRTEPSMDRVDTYSWIKAARLAGKPCEVGPVARAALAGQSLGRGVLGRHRARQQEASRLLQAIQSWLLKLSVNASGLPVFPTVPTSGEGQGLVEGPRGCLGHWLTIENAVIAHYGVVTPTTWNASPRDEQGEPGPMERAMQGVSVANANDPIEVVRVVHSFDPCLQCAVH